MEHAVLFQNITHLSIDVSDSVKPMAQTNDQAHIVLSLMEQVTEIVMASKL